MLNIYIIRHGQDEDNAQKILNGRRDKPLTKKGFKQAQKTRDKIIKSKIKFDKIYSSPLKRAHQTAKIISSKNNFPSPIILENLTERDFGSMSGKPVSKIIDICFPKIIKTEKVVYFLKAKNSETFPQLIKRGASVISQIRKENKDGNILLVTHGDIGKMIYASFYGLKWKEVLKKFYFNNTDLILLSKSASQKNQKVIKKI